MTIYVNKTDPNKASIDLDDVVGYNGPSAASSADSDVNLYGNGSVGWGEGINENVLRLTENFACPPKAGLVEPQDETNFSEPGFGVNNPIEGQLWYNTDAGYLYVYNGSTWDSVSRAANSATQPATGTDGDLWFDPTTNLLYYYDGTTWNQIVTPDFVSDDYLPLTGGELSGILTIDTHVSGVAAELRLQSNNSTTRKIGFYDNLGNPTGGIEQDPTDDKLTITNNEGGASTIIMYPSHTAVNKRIECSETINGSSPLATLTTRQYVDNAILGGGSGYLELSGGTMTGDIDLNSSEKIVNIPTPTAGGDAVNLSYLNTRLGGTSTGFLPLSGGAMSGNINMQSSRITNLLSPASTSEPTTQGYTDGRYLKLTGGTLTGPGNLTVGGNFQVNGTLTAVSNAVFQGNLTVNSNDAASYIYMGDTDNGTRTIHCNSNRIGFLTQASTWGSYCNDDGSWTSIGEITAFSDKRVKDDIEIIHNAVERVKEIRGVTFTRNDMEDNKRRTGVIAQEVEQVLPEAVITDDDGMKSVAYGNMVGLLIEAIKEQQDRIEALEELLRDK